MEERRAYLIHEDDRVRNIVEKQERAVSRLQEVMAVVARIKGIEQNVNNLLSADDSSNLTPHDLLGPFADEFDELLGRYPDEYKDLSLDEVVVGAVAPIVSDCHMARWCAALTQMHLVPTYPARLGPTGQPDLCSRRAQALPETLPHRQGRRQAVERHGTRRIWLGVDHERR